MPKTETETETGNTVESLLREAEEAVADIIAREAAAAMPPTVATVAQSMVSTAIGSAPPLPESSTLNCSIGDLRNDQPVFFTQTFNAKKIGYIVQVVGDSIKCSIDLSRYLYYRVETDTFELPTEPLTHFYPPYFPTLVSDSCRSQTELNYFDLTATFSFPISLTPTHLLNSMSGLCAWVGSLMLQFRRDTTCYETALEARNALQRRTSGHAFVSNLSTWFHRRAAQNHWPDIYAQQPESEPVTVVCNPLTDCAPHNFLWGDSTGVLPWANLQQRYTSETLGGSPDAYHCGPRQWMQPGHGQAWVGIELEICAKSTPERGEIVKIARDLGILAERDASLDGNCGVELIGPPMPIEMYFDKDSIWGRFWNCAGKFISPSGIDDSYGLHATVNVVGMLSRLRIQKFAYLMTYKDDFERKFAGRDTNGYCKSIRTEVIFSCDYDRLRALSRKSQLHVRSNGAYEIRKFKAPHSWLVFQRRMEYIRFLLDYSDAIPLSHCWRGAHLAPMLLWLAEHREKYRAVFNYAHSLYADLSLPVPPKVKPRRTGPPEPKQTTFKLVNLEPVTLE